jgi:hypothetical protein
MDGTTSEAFELQEMGEAGTGSLERGDASGEIFWVVVSIPGACLEGLVVVLQGVRGRDHEAAQCER